LPKAYVEAARRRSVLAIKEVGIVWIKSYVSEAEGKSYCEYDAPNPEAIIEHARIAGIPVNKISEVSMEISPLMFV
jgi:hypothetical protein